MKTFKVVTLHTIFEDDYNEGELEMVNSHTQESTHIVETPLMAVIKHYEGLGYTFKPELANNDDGEAINYSNQVDEESSEASSYQINQWKEGKLKLYSDNTQCVVYELVEVRVNLEG